MAKKKATQKYISEFKSAREEWKVLERERMEEENRRILQFSKLQEQRENARMESKKQKEEAMARVQHAVSLHAYHCLRLFRVYRAILPFFTVKTSLWYILSIYNIFSPHYFYTILF